MHGVDANILVRYLTGDDPQQAAKARAVIGQKPVFVPRSVLLEVEWVLRGAYDLPPAQIIPALRALAGLPSVSVEDAGLVAKAMNWAEAGMDFADAIHLAAAAGCESFLTFDQRFARSGMRFSGSSITAPGRRQVQICADLCPVTADSGMSASEWKIAKRKH